jgi:hypothetical protein
MVTIHGCVLDIRMSTNAAQLRDGTDFVGDVFSGYIPERP